MFKIILTYFLLLLFMFKCKLSVILTNINVDGNDRISNETIKCFLRSTLNDDLSESDLNKIIKKLIRNKLFWRCFNKINWGEIFIYQLKKIL